MTTTKKLKSEGFVLKKKSLPSQDILLTAFTKEYGKIYLLAKGVKKLTSKRNSSIQTGNLVTLLAHQKGEYYYLSESHLTSAFSSIKKSDEKTSALYLVLFIIDRLLPQDQKEYDVYNVMKNYIFSLAKSATLDMKELETFINSLLHSLGYLEESKTMPQLKTLIEDLTQEKLPFYII